MNNAADIKSLGERAAANLQAKLAANAEQMRLERIRLQSLADQAVIDSHAVPTLEALIADADDELDPSDNEIITLGEEMGLTLSQWVDRLDRFVRDQRAMAAEVV